MDDKEYINILEKKIEILKKEIDIKEYEIDRLNKIIEDYIGFKNNPRIRDVT